MLSHKEDSCANADSHSVHSNAERRRTSTVWSPKGPGSDAAGVARAQRHGQSSRPSRHRPHRAEISAGGHRHSQRSSNCEAQAPHCVLSETRERRASPARPRGCRPWEQKDTGLHSNPRSYTDNAKSSQGNHFHPEPHNQTALQVRTEPAHSLLSMLPAYALKEISRV